MKTINASLLFILALSASTAANAAGSMLRVACEGDDVGAEVYINGKFKGECPVDIQIKEGAYKLRMEKKDASYERVFEQDIRMGDGIVKKVEAVLSNRLNAAGQKLEDERLAVERAESERREADEARKRAEFVAELAPKMIPIPGKNYEIGKFEISLDEWNAVMGHLGKIDARPAEGVSWHQAQTYIQKLNAKTGRQYRLPSEAEWEYACYGGSQTKFCGGSNLDAVGWYDKNSGKTTHPVGQKQANGYGLYNMSGNVWEWTNDCFEGECTHYVLRGGSWNGSSQDAHVTSFYGGWSASRFGNTGFRLARTLP